MAVSNATTPVIEMSINLSSCKFKGRIIQIQNDMDADTSSNCYRFPCLASVAILEVQACGNSVSEKLQEGDIITLRFAFTTAPSLHAFPSMKKKYPGLKNGDVFWGIAEQRLTLGSTANFIVYDYLVL